MKEFKKLSNNLLKLKKLKCHNFYIRCHKFLVGHFIRAHDDNYVSKLAFKINLNEKWKANWGDLLNDKDNKINTLVYVWNSMNVLISNYKNSEDRKSNHFVTYVEKYL